MTGHKPARRVVRPTGRHFQGYFPSQKMGRMVAYDSLLERDALFHFEFSPWVVSFREQPERIIYYIDGEPNECFPDFEVVTTDGVVIHIEVKPKAKIRKQKYKAKYDAIAEHYARNNRIFRILTEDEIRVQPRLNNLKKLKYHNRKDGCTTKQQESWCQTVRDAKALTVQQAQEALGGNLKKVYRLIAGGYLICDMNTLIGPASEIGFVKEGKSNDPILT